MYGFKQLKEANMEKNAVYELHWQKACEYLMQTNHETVKFTFLERMEQICWGFGEYMLDNYTIEERISFPMLEALDRKRRQLKKRNRKVIREVVRTGKVTPEYEQYIVTDNFIRAKTTAICRESPLDLYLRLPNEKLIRIVP